MAEHFVCLLSEIDPATPRVARFEGVSVLLCKTSSGELFAFENKCTHADLPLHKGPWDSAAAHLTCPAHQAVFSLREAGKAVVGPAVVALELWPVRVADDGGVHLTIPEAD
jgi:nitrite reductase/ring-hydroxylating ferredoxin subunit